MEPLPLFLAQMSEQHLNSQRTSCSSMRDGEPRLARVRVACARQGGRWVRKQQQERVRVQRSWHALATRAWACSWWRPCSLSMEAGLPNEPLLVVAHWHETCSNEAGICRKRTDMKSSKTGLIMTTSSQEVKVLFGTATSQSASLQSWFPGEVIAHRIMFRRSNLAPPHRGEARTGHRGAVVATSSSWREDGDRGTATATSSSREGPPHLLVGGEAPLSPGFGSTVGCARRAPPAGSSLVDGRCSTSGAWSAGLSRGWSLAGGARSVAEQDLRVVLSRGRRSVGVKLRWRTMVDQRRSLARGAVLSYGRRSVGRVH